ncbi:MAG: glycosyltransferase family 4 protein [Patescibacteria group bacterium]
MNILVVSAVLPYPLYSGGQIRLYNLLRILSRDHSIHLVAYIRDESEKKYLKNLSFCASVRTVYRGRAWQLQYILKTGLSRYPFLYETYNIPEAKREIQEVLDSEKIDLIHIEPSYVWLGLPLTNIPIVAVEHNIEHDVYAQYAKNVRFSLLRWLLNIDIKKMIRAEETVWKSVSSIVAVSGENKSFIVHTIPNVRVNIVRNGVDLNEFVYQKIKDLKSDPIFLYVGNFAWMENRDAVEYLVKTLWPKIRERYTNATLRIVGKSLSDALRNRIQGKNIKILEHVERIQDELQNATIMLAPIRIGGGTKYKILEAMASGFPVITTTLGSEGLDTRHGENVLIANTVDETLTALDILMKSPVKYNTIRKNARKLIETQYSFEGIAKELDAVWRNTS